MNNKFIKISGLVFLGLVLVLILPWIEESVGVFKKQNPINISVDLSEFTKESVNKIIIKKNGTENILSIKDGKWFLGEEAIDENKVVQLFRAFSDLKISEIVSQNEDNQGKFGVARDGNLQLVITKNGKDSLFFVGKPGQAINDFYLRKDGIKTVYLVSGELKSILDWDAGKWKKIEESKK